MNSFMFENGKIFNKKSKTFEDGTICVSKGKIISGSNGVKEELKMIDCIEKNEPVGKTKRGT